MSFLNLLACLQCLGYAQHVPADIRPAPGALTISIKRSPDMLAVDWPTPNGWGHISFDLTSGKPLILALSTSLTQFAPKPRLGSLASLDVAYFLTVGTRAATSGRPPEMSIWNEFFDNPANRPYRTYRSN